MTSGAETMLSAIEDAVIELEAVVKEAAAMVGEEAEAAEENLRARLDRVTKRVRGLEQELRRRIRSGANTANDYVNDNPWRSLGIAAAVAFLLGALVSRRE